MTVEFANAPPGLRVREARGEGTDIAAEFDRGFGLAAP